MREESLRLPERFVSLALAQALLRKGYEVEANQRMPGGYEADLAAYKPPGKLRLVIEIKTISAMSAIQGAVRAARQQLARAGAASAKRFVAIGLRGAETVFVDEGLLRLLHGAHGDLDLQPLSDPLSDA